MQCTGALNVLIVSELAAGATVFSEGEHGDGFYVIERGEVEVLIAGRGSAASAPVIIRRDRTPARRPAHRDDRNRTEVLLQRLDPARFIGTVAGDPASSNAADAVVGARLGMRTPWDLGAGSPGLAS